MSKQSVYEEYLKTIEEYIYQQPFQDLLKLYGYTEQKSGNLYEDITAYAAFAQEKWDFRGKHGGAERSSITADDSEDIVDFKRTVHLLDAMGMMRTKDLSLYPVCDYILPLGGASDSNRTRVILAKDACDNFHARKPETAITVCALSAEREITREAEIQATEKFAPGARTEYEAITGGMKLIFSLNDPKIMTEVKSENPHLQWKKSVFASKDENTSYYTLSAPSSDPEQRRANTLDTFIHFLKEFDVKEGEKVLLCSTAIYGPYQLSSLMPAAIECGVELYFAGRPSNPDTMPLSFVPNVLQEVNSALRTMKALIEQCSC